MTPDPTGKPRPYSDLTDFIEVLRRDYELMEIHEEVDPRYEMGAVLRVLGEREGPAVLFTRVTGYPGHQVAGNLLGRRRRAAKALRVEKGDLNSAYLSGKEQRVPPVASQNAVQGVFMEGGDVDLLKALPALTHHAKDTSPYMTCAVTFSRDPKTGRQSMGLHRIQVRSKDRLAIYLASPPLSDFLRRAKKQDQPLEVAITVGLDPAIVLGAVTWCPEGLDKLEIAGGLRGEAVEVAPCRSVDLFVPSQAHYLIEGVIEPGKTATEGVFGESSGIYVQGDQSPLVRVTAVSHKKNPVYHALQPWSGEDDTLFDLCFGADLLQSVRKDYPFVLDLHLIPGTVSAHAIVALDECPAPMVRSCLAALLSRNPFIKRAVAVNNDINIRNAREVEWAMATRFQADRDLLYLNGVYGSVIDPSCGPDAATCKVGIDATALLERRETFKKIGISDEYRRRAEEILDRALGG